MPVVRHLEDCGIDSIIEEFIMNEQRNIVYRKINRPIKCLLLVVVTKFIFINDVQAANAEINAPASECELNVNIKESYNYKIIVQDNIVKKIYPHHFGFNIEWVGFQHSHWKVKENSINSSVIDSLKKDFKGAIYRYPGGSVSNRFNWRSSMGDPKLRPKQKAVNWKPQITTEFGYKEYREFIDAVDGIPWLVNNLYGNYYEELNSEVVSRLAYLWTKNSLNIEPKVLRWELGNELDRGRYMWSVDKYTSRAVTVAEAIKEADPSAKLVSMLRDFNVEGPGSAITYNRKLIEKTRDIGTEYVLHQYYDAPLGGPSVKNRLKYICKNIVEIEKYKTNGAKIWITEHARAPVKINKKTGWKKHYPKTSDLQSAISVADYVIGLSQIPEVEGAFIHSLSKSDGPWTLFHYLNNNIKQSIVYWSLQVLRENILTNVLDIEIESRNDSKYLGGYDLRASVLTNENRSKYNLWMVNRSKDNVKILFKLPQLALKTVNAVVTKIHDKNLDSNNMYPLQNISPIKEYVSLKFDANGVTWIQAPGFSISSIVISAIS